jgi:hypothetical protein
MAGFKESERVKSTAGATGVDLRLTEAATIEGRVIDARTRQAVTVFSIDSTPPQKFIRDPEGKFTLTNIEAGTYVVNISADGYAPGAIAVPGIVPGETRRGVTVELTTGLELSGTVKDSAGNAIEGASVRIDPAGGGAIYYAMNTRTATAKDGSFHLSSLPAGTVRFFASKEDFPSKFVSVTLSPGALNRLDIVLSVGGSVSGLVTFDGKPATGIDVNVGAQNTGRGGKTDASGRYFVEHLPAGAGRVSAYVNEEGKNRAAERDVTIVEGQIVQADLNLTSGSASISGTIFVSPGAPVKERTFVTVRLPDEGVSTSTSTQPGGRYALNGISAGAAELQVSSTNGEQKRIPVQFTEGQTVQKDIVLSEGATLHVTVSGRGSVMLQVCLYAGSFEIRDSPDRENPTLQRARLKSLWADQDPIQFKALEPGTYTVLVFEWDRVKSALGQNPVGRWISGIITISAEPEITINLAL